jgi:hypothetical protein
VKLNIFELPQRNKFRKSNYLNHFFLGSIFTSIVKDKRNRWMSAYESVQARGATEQGTHIAMQCAKEKAASEHAAF